MAWIFEAVDVHSVQTFRLAYVVPHEPRYNLVNQSCQRPSRKFQSAHALPSKQMVLTASLLGCLLEAAALKGHLLPLLTDPTIPLQYLDCSFDESRRSEQVVKAGALYAQSTGWCVTSLWLIWSRAFSYHDNPILVPGAHGQVSLSSDGILLESCQTSMLISKPEQESQLQGSRSTGLVR